MRDYAIFTTIGHLNEIRDEMKSRNDAEILIDCEEYLVYTCFDHFLWDFIKMSVNAH